MDNSRSSWNGIDLVTLRLLLSACEEGNLAKAAARENIALSALSKRIKLLEERFGVSLLHRHDRGVRPSATAEQIVPRVREIFTLLDEIAADLRATGRGELGLVRVQAHMTAMSGLLPDRVAAFLNLHPKIDVELDEATSISIVHAVEVGACDIGMVSGTIDAPGLQCFPWHSDRLVAVLNPSSPIAAAEQVSFLQLLDQPFVALQRDSALLALFRAKATEAGADLTERTHVTSFEVAKKMVRNGLGVTVIPAAAVSDADVGVVARPLSDAWATRPLMLCVRDVQRLSHASAQFLDFIRHDRGT